MRDPGAGAIRVAFLVSHAELGGLQRYVSDVASRLNAGQFDAEVICSFGGPWLDGLREVGLRALLFEMPSRFKKLSKNRMPAGRPRPRWAYGKLLAFAAGALPYVRRLAQHFRNTGTDVVYSNCGRTQLFGGLAARMAGIPSIWHIHHEIASGPQSRLCSCLASSVVVLSQAVKSQASSFARADKVTVIYNGVDLRRFASTNGRGSFRIALGVASDQPLFGAVGWLAPHKGLRHFIEAAALVRASLRNARFAVVGVEPFDGDGSCTRELTEQAHRYGLEGSVTFAGRREDIPEVMAALEALVLPSLTEGFGRVAIEAMAAGKPVVGTRVGGIPEAVRDGETGFLVAPGDPAALAKAMIWLREHPETARRMGEAGRRRVEQHFALEKTVHDTEQLLARVAAGRRRGRRR